MTAPQDAAAELRSERRELPIYSYRQIPARIAATGLYLPAKRLLNRELPELEADASRILRLLGARERRVAAADETCSDMIAAAARQILDSADLSPRSVDRIIVASTPGDYVEPCTASVVQHKLGAICPAMDVGMSCVGWVAGIDLALRCMATGDERVLVLAGTVVSKGEVFRDPKHRAIFGDGAAGVLLEPSPPGRFLAGCLWTDGRYHDLITMPLPTSVAPPALPDEYHGRFFMGKRQVINAVLEGNLARALQAILDRGGLTREDIDVAFVHQPAKPLFELALRATGLPREKVVQDFDRYGNTISAELPISLHESVQSGRVKRGDTILMMTFGAGFTGGALLYRY